jgi:hypothetical protein
MSDASKLNRGMEYLRLKGGYADRRVACCQTCSWYEWEQRGVKDSDTVLFTHLQTEEDVWKRGGNLKRDMYLYWQGDKQMIADSLMAAGLLVEVPETDARAFKILAHS